MKRAVRKLRNLLPQLRMEKTNLLPRNLNLLMKILMRRVVQNHNRKDPEVHLLLIQRNSKRLRRQTLRSALAMKKKTVMKRAVRKYPLLESNPMCQLRERKERLLPSKTMTWKKMVVMTNKVRRYSLVTYHTTPMRILYNKDSANTVT